MTSPDQELMFFHAANARRSGDLVRAAGLYRQILQQLPDSERAREGLKLVEADMGAEPPPSPQELHEFTKLSASGSHAEIIARGEALVRRDPNSPVVNGILAATYMATGKYQAARDAYRLALAGFPEEAVLLAGLGDALFAGEEYDAAIEAYRAALAINPAMPMPAFRLARLLHGSGRHEEAVDAYRNAAELDPGSTGLNFLAGRLLRDLGRNEEALEQYDRELVRAPGNHFVLGQMLFERLQSCDWTTYDRFAARGGPAGEGSNAMSPFAVLSLDDDPASQLARAQAWARHMMNPVAETASPPVGAPSRDGRIRLGYFTGDFTEHPVLQLFAAVLRNHDRQRFEVHVFSYGDKREGSLREELIAGIEHFHDVAGSTDAEIVARAHAVDLDIAVDLTGFTGNSRARLFASRLGRVQVNYLGFPGTMGSPHIDYIVADRGVIPAATRPHFSEQPIYLPHAYLPVDNRLAIGDPQTRARWGLPDDAFVFCCLNNSYKIAPETFDIWCRLLGKVEGSVLWLLGGRAAQNLTEEAGKRGIAPERLVFADRVDTPSHIARLHHADLFLDTFAYNAHTSAAEALIMGLPLVTLRGRSFAARVAASLLAAAGMEELITDSAAGYESLALVLASDRERLAGLRRRLVETRDTAPLFDSGRYTRNLEAGFAAAVERHTSGLAPAEIAVTEAQA